MLGDRSRFASGEIAFADGVDQARFSMVDVAHKGDHRGPELEMRRVARQDLFLNRFVGDFNPFFFGCIDADFAAKFMTK